MALVIAFEGIDGSGKTVQMQHLEQKLLARGLRVDTLSFPAYHSFFGRHIGSYLTCSEGVCASNVDGKSMALWFALDRFEALRNYSMEHLDVVLMNRYVLSNAVYQSIRDRDLHKPDLLDFVLELEHEHFYIPKADLYIYLDVHIENASKNVTKKGYRDYAGHDKDVYESQVGIQLRARAKYLEYATRLPNIAVVPCMQNTCMRTEEEIANSVFEALMERNLLETMKKGKDE